MVGARWAYGGRTVGSRRAPFRGAKRGGNTVGGRLQEPGMADRLPDFDFTLKPPQQKKPPFPLDDWLDGSIWRIWQGEDFDLDRRAMRSRLFRYAHDRSLGVTTRFLTDGDRHGIVFRCTGARDLHRDDI